MVGTQAMIVPADLAKLILQGKKTMACFSATKPKCFYRPGHDYSLQAGGWFELPPKTLKERITVEVVRRCRTDEIDLRDAKRLGFRSRAAFFERWDGSDDVWLVSFVLGIHTDQPRLLAANPGSVQYTAKKGERWKISESCDEGDYVSSPSRAAHGTAEEVSEAAQKRFALEAVGRYQITQAERSGRLQMALEAIREHGGKGPETNQRLRKAQQNARHHADPVVYDVG